MTRPGISLFLLLAALALCPVVVPAFWVFIIMQVMVFALYAVSFNLLLGYGGMLAFGHAAFFGVGAYAFAILLKKLDMSPMIAMALAPFIAMAAGGIVAFFCIRLTGIYFGMLTLAFQMVIYTIIFKSYDMTGGDDGISGLTIPGALGTPHGLYELTLVIVAVSLFLSWRLVHSPFGIALRAQAHNERKSLAIGVNVAFHKWIAFAVAAFFAGVAGDLFAVANESVFPDWLDWTASAVPIVMAILGGTNRFTGPIVGAVVYVVLQTILRGVTEYWALVMGAAIIALVLFLPDGILGLTARRRDA